MGKKAKHTVAGGSRVWRKRLAWAGVTLVMLLAVLLCYAAWLDYRVSTRFEGQRWALPAQVYARPLELYGSQALQREELVAELQRLGYRRSEEIAVPGAYRVSGNTVEVHTRGFVFWDQTEPARHVRVGFDGGQVSGVHEVASGDEVVLLRLDPSTIGSIYPEHGEDRVLVQLEEVPQRLVQALLAVEDRHFPEHRGIRWQSVLRALGANIRAGSVVQGGSTLTQQLVKNFYLDNRRTLTRKFNEAIMALLLERRYDKAEIMEAYLNEVYLGQDGDRAIHGFGLGSYFYFQRPLTELQDHELALLVALIRGPSWYDPRRFPERAQARRDFVLARMAESGVLSEDAAQWSMSQALGVVDRARGQTRYPAFMALVHRQLRAHYRARDLSSEGLRIFTTLDPALQAAAEAATPRRLAALERNRGMTPGSLEAATVVTDTDSGEVLVLVGGRQPRFMGFNRALDARRPIGSLVKPFVYLTALEQPRRFHAATLLDDSPLTVQLSGNRQWEPRNFERVWHGPVPLYRGLVDSYNVATVRLGMEVGVERVVATLQRAGMEQRPPAYPSLLLGSLELTPLEVTNIYQTLASGGFRQPPRAIREVTTAEGEPLQRYPLSMERVIEPAPAYVINRLLQEVVRSGTARSALATLPADWQLAGKTGTSDGLRDSWFAGFGGNRLAVTWVGRDDNEPAGLTGAAGALQIWTDVMAEARPRPLVLRAPDTVEEWWVQADTGLRSDASCTGAVQLPFIAGSGPEEWDDCAGDRGTGERRGFFRRLFGR